MRKLILVITSILLGIIGCTTKPVDVKITSLHYMTPYANFPEFLNGQIITVEEMNYHAIEKDGEVVKGELLSRTDRDSLIWTSDYKATFNENGDLTQIDRYFDDGDIRSYALEYNEKLVIKASSIIADTIRRYYTMKYNEMGLLESAKRFRAEDEAILNSYTYVVNEDGYITEATMYNADGEETWIWTFDLDDKNLNHNLKRYNSSDSLFSESKMDYNDNGFYIKAQYLNGVGELRRTIEVDYTKYDEMGNWIESRFIDDGKLIVICERKYVYY